MIGVFDSGSGGLTVLKEIRSQAPQLDVVYFGDFAHVPYGEKTPEELGALTVIAIEKLLSEGAEDIVSACNSVSASVAQPLIDLLGRKNFGMVEMIAPTVAALSNSGKKIGLVATYATIASGMYQKAFASDGVNIDTFALPGLVEAIEGQKEDRVIEESLIAGVRKLVNAKCNIIVLGCTQYPLVQHVFENVAKEIGEVEIVNPASFVASEVVKRFGSEGNGKLRFIVSKDSAFFRKLVKEFFGESTIEVL